MIALTAKTRLLARMTTLAAVGAVMVLSTGPVANAGAPVHDGVNWGSTTEGVNWGGVNWGGVNWGSASEGVNWGGPTGQGLRWDSAPQGVNWG